MAVEPSEQSMKSASSWWLRAWLAVAVLVGSALRFVGLTFGFPLRVHPDEWAIIDNAIDLAKRNSFEPTFVDRPDHFEIKLNFLVDSVYAWLRHGMSLVEAYTKHPLEFVFIGRGISAVFGVACIVLAYLIVRRVAPWAGVVAAGLVAVFPPLVLNSHYATPESPQLFFTLLLMLFCMMYLESPRTLFVVLAAASVGVGCTIKYPAIITAVMIAVVVTVVAVRKRDGWLFVRHGLVAVGSVLATIAVVSPVLITGFGRVHEAVFRMAVPEHLGADGLGWAGNAGFYASTFLGSAGLLLAVAALGGAVWSLRHHPISTLPIWAGLVYWLIMSGVALHWTRWAVPMYVTPLLFGGIGIYALVTWVWRTTLLTAGWQRLLAKAVVVLGLALLAVNQLLSATVVSVSLTAKDTRVVGRDYTKSIGATKKNTIFEGYTPMLPYAPWGVFDQFDLRSGELKLSQKALDPAKFLILSGGMRARYLAESKYAAEQEFYRAVTESLPQLRVIEPVTQGPPSVWEPLNIQGQAAVLAGYLGGGFSGPAIYFYDLSAVPRAPG